jgi:ClpP class serine protease
MLQAVPRKAKALAVVINSQGGDASQAAIIANSLKSKSKSTNMELLTFAEEFALNSAFYLFCQGKKIYADKTACIGGVQAGESKLNLGFLSQYVSPVIYGEESSYNAEQTKDEPYQEPRASEMK